MSRGKGPWTSRESGDANFYAIRNEQRWIASIQLNGEISTHEQRGIVANITAAPQLYDAVEAADTAFAVLNISDLTPQARSAVREAWPLVQEARAAARPNSAYADVVKEAHRHEIARLDGIVWDLVEALRVIRVQSIGDDWTKEQAYNFIQGHTKAALAQAAAGGFDYRRPAKVGRREK